MFASVSRYLTDHLRLVVNSEKSRVVDADGVEFLGFAFKGRRATINVSSKNVSKFKRRIRELTGRSWGISMERRLSELRSYLRGWAGYFGLAAQLKLFDKLDQCSVVSCRGRGSSYSHVLLETLALPAHAEPGANAIWRIASSGNPSREEPQGLLAYGKDHCQWSRNDEQVVAGAGTGEPEEPLGVTRSTSLNRLVRTRMPGGVGKRSEMAALTRFIPCLLTCLIFIIANRGCDTTLKTSQQSASIAVIESEDERDCRY